MDIPKLTQFSPGAGCGCKISPADLEKILKKSTQKNTDPRLLVGNHTSDDAAVYNPGNGDCIISTTDFFTPIVDDPFDFGRIAATNALSDVYAMGGKPIMAIAILGWPLDKLSTYIAGIVVDGAREVCNNAGIVLAGGHSIDVADPIFGLAVTGLVKKEQIKQNNTAKLGSKLFLTKPLGIGVITTAEKRGAVVPRDMDLAIEHMTTLNVIGTEYAQLPYVTAMTDVTGFGLLGHLLELCEGSKLSAEIIAQKVPVLPDIKNYLALKTIPGGTYRNFKSYGKKVSPLSEVQKLIFCDPQTSGGLLVAVEADYEDEFAQFSKSKGIKMESFGCLISNEENQPIIRVVD